MELLKATGMLAYAIEKSSNAILHIGRDAPFGKRGEQRNLAFTHVDVKCAGLIASTHKLDFCLRFVHALAMQSIAGENNDLLLQPGQLLARGVARYLRQCGFATLEEFVPDRGLRVDVFGLGPKGELWIVECKSSRVDFQSDSKWKGYLPWCDRYFWAVDGAFPTEILPSETGLIIADAYDAEIIRMGPEQKLAPTRRKKLTQKLAFDAAQRLQTYRDPGVAAIFGP